MPPRRVDEVKQMIRSELANAAPLLRGYKVLLFGSRARGTARPQSDFDLGVVGDSPLPLTVFYAIEDRLEALPTLHRIDWVDLNRASAEFRERAARCRSFV